MTQQEINDILKRVYDGQITLEALPVELYEYYAAELQKAVYKGYRKTLNNLVIASDEWTVLNYFRENVNIFSGAKTFQQINDLQNFILDKNKELRPFYDYMHDAKKIDAMYRKDWLKTERNTTIAQAQSARKWNDIEAQKDILPYLIFRTQGDSRVRDEHKALEGFTALVDDFVWNSITPPLGFNCRCTIEQVQQSNPDSKEQIKERIDNFNKDNNTSIKSLSEAPDKLFRMNPAKDKIIFKNEGIGSHPYFKVDEAYEVLKTNNFNFDINYSI